MRCKHQTRQDTGGDVAQPEEHTATHTVNRYRSFRYELVLGGVVIGALVDAVVVAFRYLIGFTDVLLNMILDHGRSRAWLVPVWVLILAAATCVVSLLLKWDSLISGSGVPQIEREIIGEVDEKWRRMLLAKLGGGVISLGHGLSLGREGPSIQLGAVATEGFSGVAKRVKIEEELLTICRANTELSIVFNAPVAGVLSALEEIHKHFSSELLLPSTTASITSDSVPKNMFGLALVFSFRITHMMPLDARGYVLVLGVIMGAMGVAYNIALSKTQDLYRKISWGTVKLLIPFLPVGVPGPIYHGMLGGGHALVGELSAGEMALDALYLLLTAKLAFSMVSFGSGAPGGIFLPLPAMGTITGNIYYNATLLVGPSLSGLMRNFIVLGVAGYFSTIVRVPITGIILVSKVTGSLSYLLTLFTVSLTTYLVLGMVHCAPVYNRLLHRLLARQSSDKKIMLIGGKVLVEGVIYHGSVAKGKGASTIAWPRTSLVVSLMYGEAEFVPRGDTMLRAGDKIIVLCDEISQGQLHGALREYCEAVTPMQKGQ